MELKTIKTIEVTGKAYTNASHIDPTSDRAMPAETNKIVARSHTSDTDKSVIERRRLFLSGVISKASASV